MVPDSLPGTTIKKPQIKKRPPKHTGRISNGAASLTDGFPPLTFLAVTAGGVPPFGQDMNGLLNQITAGVRWEQVGGQPVYNATFANAIGGYPNGAVLQRADGSGFRRNTATTTRPIPTPAPHRSPVPSRGQRLPSLPSSPGRSRSIFAT
jgi:hypothetical protein